MAKTTTQFLSAVKRRISMPENQALLSDEAILEIGDEVMRAYVVPTLISVRQDYFVYVSDTTLVVDQTDYAIPYRALGRSLRDLKVVDTTSTTVRDLVKIDLEDAHLFTNDNSQVRPYGFHFFGDQVRLQPSPQTTNLALRFFFELPPNKLVTVGSAATITGISGGDITVNAVPTTFSTSTATDFIAGKQGNATRAFDKTPTNIAGTTISYATADVPSTLAVGDYIALAEESPVLQIPDDMFPWMVTKTGRRVLYAIGDFEGDSRLQEADSEEEKNLLKILEPRIRGETTKIVNRFSLARQGRFYYGRGIIF